MLRSSLIASALVGMVTAGCTLLTPAPPGAAAVSPQPPPRVAGVASPSPVASGPSPVPGPTAWTPPPQTKTAGCAMQAGLPDSACTPGGVDSRVNAATIGSTICTPGYSRSVRPPTSVTDRIKREQMAAYGVPSDPPSDFELDHLISLELGGAPADVANLWPEPLAGDNNAHQKDAVENFLHEQVCRTGMPLSQAQRQIATDWESVFRDHNLAPANESVD